LKVPSSSRATSTFHPAFPPPGELKVTGPLDLANQTPP
jgi:hypothetical protein